MNTDGHLRSVFFGRSENITLKDGVLDKIGKSTRLNSSHTS